MLPTNAKKHQTQRPDNLDPTTLNAQWGTNEEKEKEATRKRKMLQKSTQRLDGKLLSGRKIIMGKAFKAWQKTREAKNDSQKEKKNTYATAQMEPNNPRHGGNDMENTQSEKNKTRCAKMHIY